jgi:glycosyltransferase involved in cell wall biosynthesis
MRFSIVTPAFNSERFIGETIESVLSQRGDFSIDYIVTDNCSSDGTLRIIEDYRRRLSTGEFPIHCRGIEFRVFSEPDRGMYDAINRGFMRATGDVYAWINSDDVYLPGAFDVIARSLDNYPHIRWIKGITSYMNVHSNIFAAGRCNLYRQDFIKAGLYGPVLHFIQQDSVFWKADLWKQSEGVDAALSLAGDYVLWRAFAELTPLYSLDAQVSCFRRTPEQKSADLDAYLSEARTKAPLDETLAAKARRHARRIESLPRRMRSRAYRWVFGRHPFHLLKLKEGVEPLLVSGDDYFALRGQT